MQAEIRRSGIAAAVPEKAGLRLGATGFQGLAQHIDTVGLHLRCCHCVIPCCDHRWGIMVDAFARTPVGLYNGRMPSPRPQITPTLPETLTREQRAIITAPVEHTVITAVAGSGKTTTLAWRIRHLLEQGVSPDRLLVLMFNRSARQDFLQKLTAVCGDSGLQLPDIRTYHAMGLRLYRRFVREGYLQNFSETLLGEGEINFQLWQLVRRLAPEEQAEEIRRSKKEFVELAAGFVDRVKTTLSPAEIVFEEQGYDGKHRFLVDVFHSFEQWRKSQARISYADMLYEPVMAIHQNPPLQRLVANKMDVVLVDEYQDTNEIQHLLLGYIAGDRARVTVVGDPDQTIYEFRGARPDFILHRFGQEFDRPRQQTLSVSFRHGHRIALLANHLITHNQGRRDILSHAHENTPYSGVSLHEQDSDSEAVLTIIEQQTPDERSQSAVLFRVWSQSVAIELKLLARQIPYRIDAGKGALFSREVEGITAVLTLVAGQLGQMPDSDRVSLAKQLLQFPHVGLKETELMNLAGLLARFSGGWGERLSAMDFDALAPLPGRKLRRLGETLTRLEHSQGPVGDVIDQYAEGTELFEGVRSLALTHDSAEERVDTIRGFRGYLAALDVSAGGALAHLQHLRQQARDRHQGSGVLLSTIHRTKGLEWPTVIIPGLQEKRLPYTARAGEDLAAVMESERRLLYVAITRTRDWLHLVTRKPVKTASLDADQGPSRFMAELNLPLSCDLAEQLYQAAQGAEPTACLTVAQPLTRVSERYARRQGHELTSSNSEQALAWDGPVWTQARLQHAMLGSGQVVAETDSAFEVRFDAGQTLNFSKKSAHLYFSAVD